MAASMLLFGASAAGITCVAVKPEARGQGIGAALTLAPLREVRSEGYQVAVLQASKVGTSVYRAIGFEQYCTFSLHRWSGPPPAARS